MSQWIKCSDWMPDDQQRVLVYIDGLDVCYGFTYHEETGDFVDDDGMSLVDEVITHWMRLPDPPEVE